MKFCPTSEKLKWEIEEWEGGFVKACLVIFFGSTGTTRPTW